MKYSGLAPQVPMKISFHISYIFFHFEDNDRTSDRTQILWGTHTFFLTLIFKLKKYIYTKSLFFFL